LAPEIYVPYNKSKLKKHKRVKMISHIESQGRCHLVHTVNTAEDDKLKQIRLSSYCIWASLYRGVT